MRSKKFMSFLSGSGLVLASLVVAAAPATPAFATQSAASCTTSVPIGLYPGTKIPMKGTTNTVANRNCLLGERNQSDAVKALQYAAVFCYGQWDEEDGFDGLEDLDGVFGPKTKAWVKNVQSAVGVTADGTYGNNTHNAMAFWRETVHYVGVTVHVCAFDPVAV